MYMMQLLIIHVLLLYFSAKKVMSSEKPHGVLHIDINGIKVCTYIFHVFIFIDTTEGSITSCKCGVDVELSEFKRMSN